MNENLALGIAGVIVGGILNGSFVAPMKKMNLWKWENSWFVYSITGLLIIPWIVAPLAVPNLGQVLSGASAAAIAMALLFASKRWPQFWTASRTTARRAGSMAAAA